ncbi:MAG: S8 family serine peptidase [Chloroflexota bacterium]
MTTALLALLLIVPAAQARQPGTLPAARFLEHARYDSYIVIMKARPVAATFGRDLGNGRAESLGRTLTASHDRTLRWAGLTTARKGHDYVNTLNGFQARVTYREALALAADKNVALVLPDLLRSKLTDSSGEFMGLDQPGGAWKTGVTGKGVVVGVIDTGIWPEHPSFANHGLPAPPTGPLPCEFGNTAHNPQDHHFNCNRKLIGARQMLDTYREFIGADADEFDSARDDDGHGTHTASTAAGNAGVQAKINGVNVGSGKISGIAPDAHIVAYKALGNLGGFTSDLAAAIDQAVEDGVDVINYSIGGPGGEIAPDAIAFLFAADAGVFAAVSAGNDGPGPATIGGPADFPWVTTVGANTQSRFFEGKVTLGNGHSYSGGSIRGSTNSVKIVDAAKVATGSLGAYCLSTATGTDKLKASRVQGKIVLCRRGINGRVDKSLAVKNAGGVGLIIYNGTNDDDLFSDNAWVPTVTVDKSVGLAIKSYIKSLGAGATARIHHTGDIGTWPYAPSVTYFSSRGPNSWPDVIKPDITAPGLHILAGASPRTDPGEPSGQLFQAIGGTSMSSPHVAGLFALLKQVHPDWSAAMARSALMTTAYTGVLDNDRSSGAGPFAMGSGHANPGGTSESGSAFQPGLVYDAGLYDYFGWLCGIDLGVLTEEDCEFLDSVGYSSDPSNLNYPSIAVADLPGTQVVTRTFTSVAKNAGYRTYKVSVDAPVGYKVSVSPATISINRGQSATYQVSLVNKSAPLGAWRFGSLTWTDVTGGDPWPTAGPTATAGASDWSNGGKFTVRSPIALRASRFDAPAHVSGNGVSGSESFQVRFGYTGAYSAKPRGLVPATVTHGTVDQDADQSFFPSDAGDGATVHSFNLSGVGLFRIALPPDAVASPNTDLDVYVYDPDDNLVGFSFFEGTRELVDIVNPQNGTWKVYVHGWQTVGPSDSYDLYTWKVPRTGGGSLSIASAPSSATAATAGTVTVHWTGATNGKWHLGLVQHVGPSGVVMGQTLVEVDNR